MTVNLSMRAASGGKSNGQRKKQQQPKKHKTRMYHLSVKTISRANGSSAAASAAYRSGQEVTNERTGEVHDYTRKQGVEHTEIVASPAAPEWANNRSVLWSAAEQAEKRKDATVAREFQVAIPKELTREQGIALVREFAAELVDKHRFAADIAIHKDDPKKWDGSEKGFIGYHAHILCSTRRLTAEGFNEKTRELDGMKAGREHIQHWRERWEIVANKHLQIAGHEQRIDHRSLKDQGIEGAPTKHLGVDATAMERRGEKTEIGDSNRGIQQKRQEFQQQAADRQEFAAIVKEEKVLKASIEAAQKEHAKLTLEAAKPEKSVKQKIAELSIDDQIAVFHALRDKIEKECQKKALRVAIKAEKRYERRSQAAHENRWQEPKPPTGLLALFKQASYAKAQEAWKATQRYADKLATQGQSLSYKLANAGRDCKDWSFKKIRQAQPDLVIRIDLHLASERKKKLEEEMVQRKQHREKDHGRGHGR